MLKYLYTDECDINLDNAMELFEAADVYGIDRLKLMCEQTIMINIDVENAAAIFHASDLHNAASLREKAMAFVLHHFDDVSRTKSFEHLARSNVDLMLEILRNRNTPGQE